MLANIVTTFPLTYPEALDGKSIYSSEAYSIVLAINQKESMLIDPSHWEEFKKALLVWSEQYCPNLSIPELQTISLSFESLSLL